MTEGKELPSTVRTEWLVWYLRWLMLTIALILTLLNANWPTGLSLFYAVWAVTAIYNLIILLLLVFKWFPTSLSVVTLSLDTICVLALILTSGGNDSALSLLGLFPVLIAALRYGLNVSLAMTTIITLSYITFLIFEPIDFTQTEKLLATAVNMIMLFLVAVVAGLLSNQQKHIITEEQTQELQDLRLERDRAKVFYRMASTLNATLNYERVLDTMLDVSLLGLGELDHTEKRTVSIVFLFDEKGLRVAASRHLHKDDQRERIKGEAGLVAQAITQAEAVIGDNVRHDPELSRFTALQHCRSVICVPLRAGFENYGVVLFASPRRRAYTQSHVELLNVFADQASVALQNAQLYQSLREEKDRIINADEEARHKLARDLHDGPTQAIAAVAMRLNFIKVLLTRDPAKVKEEVEQLEELARKTTKEIRTMLFTLRPVVLETQGLVGAIEQYVQKIAEVEDSFSLHLQVQVKPEELAACLDVETAGVIFSIIEEGVNNAKKHAEASNVWVRLEMQNGLLIAEVEDDGQGFDLAAVEETYDQRGSLGLINLRERADLIDGRLDIRSMIGQGTIITLAVPLNRKDML